MPKSTLYTGIITHCRYTPVKHMFQYRIAMPLIDLEELPDLFKSHRLYRLDKRFALIGLQQRSYLSGNTHSLAHEARQLVQQKAGFFPQGPVRLLTGFQYFGFTMNPVSFYYLYSRNSEVLEAVIAEVTNTPWRQRHWYVLDTRQRKDHTLKKELHVSPFMGMDQSYQFSLEQPGKSLRVEIANYQQAKKVFQASLTLKQRPWNHRELTRLLVTYPPISLRVAVGIYWNALQLKLKRTPHFRNPHPEPPGHDTHQRTMTTSQEMDAFND